MFVVFVYYYLAQLQDCVPYDLIQSQSQDHKTFKHRILPF